MGLVAARRPRAPGEAAEHLARGGVVEAGGRRRERPRPAPRRRGRRRREGGEAGGAPGSLTPFARGTHARGGTLRGAGPSAAGGLGCACCGSRTGRCVAGGRELVRPRRAALDRPRPHPREHRLRRRDGSGSTRSPSRTAAHEDQRPKFEQYPGALFSVVHRLVPTPDDTGVLALEIDAFLTAEALVTFHSAPIAEVDRVFERCAAEPELLARGPDFVLYLVHDALTDVHFALVDALTARSRRSPTRWRLSAADVDGTSCSTGSSALRRAHAILRRRLSPQREVFAALARPGQALVKDQTAIYFRDVVDHSVRLTEEIDTGRDLLASAMDAYLSHSNNRLSAVTARLTLIATIFLPLNFIAGFFGMNLEILPPTVAVPARDRGDGRDARRDVLRLQAQALLWRDGRSRGGQRSLSATAGRPRPAPPGGCTRTSPSSSSRPRIEISTSRKRRITSAFVVRCFVTAATV